MMPKPLKNYGLIGRKIPMNRRRFIKTLAAVAVLPSVKLPQERIINPEWANATYEIRWASYSGDIEWIYTTITDAPGPKLFKLSALETPAR